VGGIHRVVAAVVKEIADVVRPKHLHEPFVLRPVFFDPLELVSRGAECTAGLARSLLVSIMSSVSAPMMPLRPA
jgi:hypothetical protein